MEILFRVVLAWLVLKILLVHNFYRSPGGEENYLKSLVNLLERSGHSVLIYSKSNKKIPKGFVPRLKIAFRMFWNKKVYRELSGVIRRFRPDIVHFNNIFPLITPSAYYACKKNRVPVVQTVHNFRYLFPKSLLIRRGKLCPYCLDKRLLYPSIIHSCYDEPLFYTASFSLSHLFHKIVGSFGLVDAFIFPSRFTKRYYAKYAGVKSSQSFFIPNFVEKTKIAQQKRGDYFLYVGRLSREKGIEDLVGLFSSAPDLDLVAVGDGPLKKKVQAFAKFKNIKAVGELPKKKVLAYMAGARATIIPSKCLEVFPTVFIESLSVGTPVVAPSLGVFKEIIKEGRTGFFYKPGDYGQLKSLLAKIAKGKNPSEMRVECKKEYADNYTGDLYYRKLLKVYSGLLKK